MPDFVGQPCILCRLPIVSILAGGLCNGCGKPIHFACRTADQEPDTFWHCSRCGGDPSAGLLAAGLGRANLLLPEGEDARLPPLPSDASCPDLPIRIPDIRQRQPIWKKVLVGVVLVVLAVGGFAGYRWLQHYEIERLVRDGFQQKLGYKVSAVNLKRSGEDVYNGTVTTTSGEEWEVRVQVDDVGRNRQISWQARAPLERAESDLRRDMETKLERKVRSIRLVRLDDGRFGGTAELESGEQFDIRENSDNSSPFLLLYEWNQATVEKWVRQSAQERFNDTLRTLSLTRMGSLNYTGKATGDSGLEYDLAIVPVNPNPKEAASQPQLNFEAKPASFPAWVSKGLEKDLKVKVKKVALQPHPAGYHTGQAFCESGEVYDLRVGTPPAWRKAGRESNPTWIAMLSPSTYHVWVKRELEKTPGIKVESLKLRPLTNGNQSGPLVLADGRRFTIVVERKKVAKQPGEEDLWPDLPEETLGCKLTPLD